MKIDVFSNNKNVIASNSVIMFTSSDELILSIKADSGFAFKIHLEFEEDETKKRDLASKVENNDIFFKCMNFDDVGAGTTNPIDIATVEGKKVYIHFWSWRPAKEVRRIQYTLFSDGGDADEE